MHPIMLDIAIVIVFLQLFFLGYKTARAQTVLERLLALDTFSLFLIAALGLFSILRDSTLYLDIALILALLSFVATLATARYYQEGEVFS